MEAACASEGTGLIAMMIVSIGLASLRYVYPVRLRRQPPGQYADYSAQAGLEIGPVSLTPARP